MNFKSYLKLQIPQQDNIHGLAHQKLEVVSCEYNLHRSINSVGKPSSEFKGGIIRISISDIPTDQLMDWVFTHQRYFNGEVSLMEAGERTYEKIYFEEARCVKFRLHHLLTRDVKTITELQILAKRIQIGNSYFEFFRK